jgi:ubiquinone/menaquinone biosynthesis C-methylase UbiE
MNKTLTEIHEDVPADHYDRGVKNNLWQKFWHKKRIHEVKKMTSTRMGNVLDVGCHSGFMTEKIIKSSLYNKIYGIDVSKEAIVLAKKRIKQGKFVLGNAHDLPFKENFFDVVFCLEILEHVEKPQKVMSEIKRVLKKNGQVIVLVPTDNLLFKSIWYVWNIMYPVWKHAHIQSFKSNSLIELLEKQGFTVEQVKRFNLNMLVLVKASKL